GFAEGIGVLHPLEEELGHLLAPGWIGAGFLILLLVVLVLGRPRQPQQRAVASWAGQSADVLHRPGHEIEFSRLFPGFFLLRGFLPGLFLLRGFLQQLFRPGIFLLRLFLFSGWLFHLRLEGARIVLARWSFPATLFPVTHGSVAGLAGLRDLL